MLTADEALRLLRPTETRRASLYEAYVEQDAQLVAAGWHPTSPWWLEQVRRLSEHPSAYCLVANVGRRGGKSTLGGRIAAVEVLDREWHVPSGDPNHYFAFLSVKRGEAKSRLDSVEAILRLRNVRYWRGTDDTGPVIRLDDRPLEWRAIPASFRTAVGGTLVGFWADELARWIDRDSSANPAAEVLAAVRPAILSHLSEGAHEYLVSSPLAEEGVHYEAAKAGNDGDQLVCSAATWEANPTLTVADCERLCRAEQRAGKDSDMDRDYRAIPTPLSAMGRLDPGLIRWLNAPPEPEPGDVLLSASDLAMKTNSSTQALGWLRGDDYYIAELHEWQPQRGEALKPSVVCSEQRAHMVRFGAHATMADGHYRESLREALETDAGWLGLLEAPSQTEAVVRLRALLQERRVHVYASADMRGRLERQMRGTRLVTTPNGLSVRMQTSAEGAHCDVVAALSLLVWQQAGATVPEPRRADYDPGYEALVRRHRELGLDRR